MSIRLIVDSASDITSNIADKYNIRVIPVTVSFGNGDYKDKIDLSIHELYAKIEKLNEVPKTSQITPNVFVDILEEELEKYDEVLLITMGAKYSGTYSSAIVAKNMINSDKIHVVDSESITVGYAHLVYEVAKKIKDGAEDINQVLKHIDYCKNNKTTIAILDTLEYLKKGGRLSATKAFVGNILNIKLIVEVKDELVPMEKQRGMKKAMHWVVDWIKENNLDIKSAEIMLVHSDAPERADQIKNILNQELGATKFIILEMGAVVGTHAGPGAVGVSFMR
ncbi:MAG: hypothetical protein A2Y24_01850 [Clostridiales bacterium GWE2_32_10]|nr:MAG: hypothetical protein A2Y24_01850 [Clostridiales bacterium GWE2_32_10]